MFRNKKLVLVGINGAGKSTTANNLAGDAVFDTGASTSRITTRVEAQNLDEGFLIIDSPGFGTTDALFFQEFLNFRERILVEAPTHAFLLVVKFNVNEAAAFYIAAEQFFRAFGDEGIKSVVIVCIQGNPARMYGRDQFRQVLIETDGYKYLKRRNGNVDIPFCLWDNVDINRHPRQREELLNLINPLPNYSLTHWRMALNAMENAIDNFNREDAIRNRPNPPPNFRCK